MKNRYWLGVLVGVTGLSATSRAVAQQPPSGVAIGVERAFEFTTSSVTVENGGVSSTTSYTTFSIGTGSDSPINFSISRLGIDYLMDQGMTIGTTFGVATLSGEVESEGPLISGSSDLPSATGFIIGPRLGYVTMFSPAAAFWPRGGITFISVGADSNDPAGSTEVSESDVALTVELPVVAMPTPYVGFVFAPTLDYLLSSTVEVNGNELDGDFSGFELGIQFGIFGVL